MTDMNRNYFLILPDSPIVAVIADALATQKAFTDALQSLKDEFGATDVITWGNASFCGLVFSPDSVPPGWRTKNDYWVPDGKTKAGREFKKRVADLPGGVDPMRFSDMLGREYAHWAGGHICWTVYRKYGDHLILSVPGGCTVQPPGCRLLKMSEYWRIVEDAKEAKEITA